MLVSSINIKDSEDYKNLLDLFFPIGSVYLTISETSPASYLGGTWAKINDDRDGFLAMASKVSSTNYTTNFATVNNTAGSMYISSAMMPAHTHTGPSHSHSVSLTAASNGSHRHSQYSNQKQSTTVPAGEYFVWIDGVRYYASAWSGGNKMALTMDATGAHTHSVSGNTGAAGTGATGSAGGGKTLCPITMQFMLERGQHKAGDALCLD